MPEEEKRCSPLQEARDHARDKLCALSKGIVRTENQIRELQEKLIVMNFDYHQTMALIEHCNVHLAPNVSNEC